MAGKIIADFMFGVGQVITGLVNDLVTGGTDKALSAEQGKVLNGKMFGVGQTMQDLTGSRSFGVTYTNSTGRVIFISVIWQQAATSGQTVLYVDNKSVDFGQQSNIAGGGALQAPIFPGQTYRVDSTQQGTLWTEWR